MIDWVSEIRNKPATDPRQYNFSAQSPGGSLTGSSPATVTLSPVPLGVNGSDTNHYLYISGGTGTAEAVLITGGTAVSGASSGTITFTPANSHSGAWTISSATAGIQEAAVATNALIYLPTGTYDIYATITLPQNHSGIIGESGGSINFAHGTYLNVHFTTSNVIYCNIPTALRLEHFSIKYASPATAGTAIYLDDTGGAIAQTVLINDISIYGGWQGILVTANAFFLTNSQIDAYYRGLIIGSSTHAAGPFINNVLITNISSPYTSAPSGGIGMLFEQTTGGLITNVIIGGPFDYGIFLDAVAPVHEIDASSIFIDGFKVGGFWVAPGSDATLWSLTAFEVNASLQLGTEQSIQLSGMKLSELSCGKVGAGQYGIVLQDGNESVSLSCIDLYSGTPAATALIWLKGAFQDVVITGCNSAGAFGTTRTNGLLADLSSSTNGGLSITGNNFANGNTTPMSITGSCPNMVIANNAGVDGTVPTVASAATIALPPNPVINISGTTQVATINGGWTGRTVTLIWTNAAPGGISSAGNVALAFSPIQNQVTRLTFDGTKWH